MVTDCRECSLEDARKRRPLDRREIIGPYLWLAITAGIVVLSQRGCAALGSPMDIRIGSWQENTATLLALVIILAGIALCGYSITALWRSVIFLRNNVIGQTFYAFCDRAGRVHEHELGPIPRTTSDTEVQPRYHVANVHAYTDASESHNPTERESAALHLVDGPILKLRRGGWFRKCTLNNPKMNDWWSAIDTWNGNLITIADYRRSITGLTATEALDIMSDRGNIGAVLTANAQRDQLLRGVVEMRTVLTRSPETIGRTKHAKVLRHLIDRALSTLPRSEQDTDTANIVAAGMQVDDLAIVREVLGPDWQPPSPRTAAAQERA